MRRDQGHVLAWRAWATVHKHATHLIATLSAARRISSEAVSPVAASHACCSAFSARDAHSNDCNDARARNLSSRPNALSSSDGVAASPCSSMAACSARSDAAGSASSVLAAVSASWKRALHDCYLTVT